MEFIYYIINIGGSRGLLTVEHKDGDLRSALAIFYGLERGFPNDYLTLHEVSKNLKTGELKTKLVKRNKF